MNARALAPIVAWLFLDVALVYAGATGEAGDMIEVRQGLLTVGVEGSPLDRVLGEIAHRSGVSIRGYVPAGETVTANLRDVPLDEGLTRILGTRGAVFVYEGEGADNRRSRLVEVHVYPVSVLGPDSAPLAAPRAPATQGSLADFAEDAAGSWPDEMSVRAWRNEEDPSIGAVTRALTQRPDAPARARAARALGEIGGDAAIAPLAASIAADPDASVRQAAAVSLGETWSEDAVTPLARALLDDHPVVRGAAAQALGEIWSEAAVAALIAALGDAHPTVRERAAAALGAIGHHEAIDALIQISRTDDDRRVRQSAERAVTKILKSH